MSENTKIEWADHTFNPWEGCQKVGPGCDHCYAENRNARFAGGTAINWGPGAPRRRTSQSTWAMPVRWNAQADAFMAQHGRRQRVFCASLADVFDNAVDPQWRADLFALIQATPHLDWLLLTKRIGNVSAMVSIIPGWMPANVWLGATIVNQEEADRDIPKLLAVPAAKRFLSMEPLLGPVDLETIYNTDFGEGQPYLHPLIGRVSDGHGDGCSAPAIDWIIVGGESGPGARPMHPDWARSLRYQCKAAGVPFLFKQWGDHDLSYDRDRDDPDYRRCDKMTKLPGRWINLAGGHGFNGDRVHYAHRVGKKAAGRLLDGLTWDEVPA
jgi:protein gp37